MKDEFDNQAYLALDIGYGVRCAAQHKPDKVALGEGNQTLNYGELADRINRVSNGVREDFGLNKTIESYCDQLIHIPMSRGTDSLNVASASAIFLQNLQQNSP